VQLISLPFFDFAIPAGLLTYPLTFILSDFVTEIFGPKKAQHMIYMAFAMNLLCLGFLEIILLIPGNDFEIDTAFHQILGLGGLRIFASLIACLVAQIVDVQLYVLIKKWTKDRFLWLRNNGSTLVSQGVDTCIIDTIYLNGALGMSLSDILPVMGFSLFYKAFFSVGATPLLYLSVFLFKRKKTSRSKGYLLDAQ
jgi:uncharacterized integral membrane protein (TIGR00697 family)